MNKFKTIWLHRPSAALVLALLCPFLLHAEEQLNNLADKEALQLQRELSWVTALMWGLLAALLLFAVAIRYIARRNTHPCRWCMEFISNKAAECPRCGKRGG